MIGNECGHPVNSLKLPGFAKVRSAELLFEKLISKIHSQPNHRYLPAEERLCAVRGTALC